MRLLACLGLATLALLAGPGPANAADAAASDRGAEVSPLPVAEVAPGVYVHVGEVADWGPGHADVANLGFVVGTRCVAVIDTGGSPATGRRWLATIAATTPVPVCHVINTHAHPDHLLGNAPFASLPSQPDVVGHARLAAALAARGPFYLNAARRDGIGEMQPGDLVAPTRNVEGTLELDLGGRTLQLRAWPTAHTDHDLSVLDVSTRTLFTGDLLFVSHLPVIDGSLRGWLAVMDELARLDVARVVPGHGAPGAEWPQALEPQRRYLRHVLDETRAAVQRGETIRAAVERIDTGAGSSWQLVGEFHRRNLTAAYAELEWE